MSYSRWRQGDRVSLAVADTINPELSGKHSTGMILQVHPAIGDRSEAAAIRLDAPLMDDALDILVVRRNRPSLFRSTFVYVIPWKSASVDDISSIDVLKQAVFIAEIVLVGRKAGRR